MTEPERTPCCVTGCKRSYKRVAGEGELICGTHWKAVRLHIPELVTLHKQAKASWRAIWRRCTAHYKAHGFVPKAMDALYDAAERRERRRWTAIKTAAQALQDGGYFARRPRARVVHKPKAAEEKIDKRGDVFEREFQRAKRAQQRGREQ